MSVENKDNQSTGLSPLIWGVIAVIALVMVFVFFSGRSGTKTEQISLGSAENTPKFAGDISRQTPSEATLAPPALGARELIRLAREKKRPYPLSDLYQNALKARADNDMENAHLLFFFTAREGYLPSILMMGEMADPLLFSEQNSLLDEFDPIQAYKWYRIAIEREDKEAQNKMNALQQWAEKEADLGNSIAQQLLLSFAK